MAFADTAGMHNKSFHLNRESPSCPFKLYLAFVAACIALALLPGPVVTLLIANGLRHGTRAALINIAGVQAGARDRDRHRRGRADLADGDHGLLVRLGALCRRGLSGLARHQADPRARSKASTPMRRRPRRAADFSCRAFWCCCSNPEGAGVLRRVHSAVHGHEPDHVSQVALLGVTFMVIAGMTDAIYALLAGRARKFFSARRTRLLSRVSGGFMIGGGIWLALTRAR